MKEILLVSHCSSQRQALPTICTPHPHTRLAGLAQLRLPSQDGKLSQTDIITERHSLIHQALEFSEERGGVQLSNRTPQLIHYSQGN